MACAKTRFSLAAAALIALAACGKKPAEPAPSEPAGGADEAAQTLEPAAAASSSDWTDARADFASPEGAVMGSVTFEDGIGGVVMRIDMIGLSPGWHGIHLHVVGDCSDGADGFKASGGHINPDNVEHGLLNPSGSHRADIPNLLADDAGRAKAEFFRAGVHLRPSEEAAAINGPFPLVDDDGFAVIVHANPDDHLTQPIGGAGERVACAAVNE